MKCSKPVVVLSMLLPLVPVTAVSGADEADSTQRFQLTSTTFGNGATLPLSMIFTSPSQTNPKINTCTLDGSTGGDQSPQLAWTGAPARTGSFVVIMYDTVASFTHWAMYNIPATTTELPENAGVAGSSLGVQVSNDFGDLSYDGPCPPTAYQPVVHKYVITVYALDSMLPVLPSSGVFPPGSEALYHALIRAGTEGHILETATIVGMYSATAPPGPGS